MRKTIAIILALVSHCIANAQQAETIESITANSHEPEWYAAQAEAWQKRVNENPQDQWAWRNLFRATCYYEQFTGEWGENQDESRTADVIRRMEATLPTKWFPCIDDSFVSVEQKASFKALIQQRIEVLRKT